jgi:predicted amidohydrolase
MEGGKPRGEGAASNGHSRIIRPDGNIIEEASIWGEDVLVADLDITEATRHLAERSRQSPLMKAWWEMGVKLVPQPGETPC